MRSEHAQWIGLSLIPEVGDSAIRRLLEVFGSPGAVLDAGSAELEHVVTRRIAARIVAGPPRVAVEATLRWLDHDGHHLLTLADADYPRSLLEISDPPSVLYLTGQRELLAISGLAVVGSRNPTAQGSDNAQALSTALSNAGLVIVSGLAEGIDAAAHRGGLAGSAGTIAVVGTGLDRVYPARNRDLAQEIYRLGALLSEFPLGTRALPGNFPRRNRIISGLAKGCLVVEAAVKSGSLITARCSLEQGREVFAVPGSIHSPLSKGCHALIRQGAKLVESAADILEELQHYVSLNPLSRRSETAEQGIASDFLDHVGYDPVDVDVLCARSQLAPEEVMSQLLKLELAGLVAALPGGLFQRRC